MPASSPCAAMNSWVRSGVRLYTLTENPLRAILRARFSPITANPTTPIKRSPGGLMVAVAVAGAVRRVVMHRPLGGVNGGARGGGPDRERPRLKPPHFGSSDAGFFL